MLGLNNRIWKKLAHLSFVQQLPVHHVAVLDPESIRETHDRPGLVVAQQIDKREPGVSLERKLAVRRLNEIALRYPLDLSCKLVLGDPNISPAILALICGPDIQPSEA